MDFEPLPTILNKEDGFYWLKDNIYPDDYPEVVLVAYNYNGRMIFRINKLIPISLDQALADYPSGLIGDASLLPPQIPEGTGPPSPPIPPYATKRPSIFVLDSHIRNQPTTEVKP